MFEIVLIESCHNDLIQAVKVELRGIASNNRNPHITVSAKKGVKPVESNKMFESNHMTIKFIHKPVILGVLEFKEFL